MLPPEKRAKIIAALKANPNAKEVAGQVGGVCVATVWNIAKQSGIKLATGQTARREARAKILTALKVNPNASAVARQVGGVCVATVWKVAKRSGINLAAAKAARMSLPPKKRAKIIAALKANPNANAVARQVGGVSVLTVWRIAKRAGIQLPVGRPARMSLPPKKRAKIIAALKANPNASAVAGQVGGVSSPTVRRIAKQSGIKLPIGRPAKGQKASPRERQGQ